jgi:CheY-like chemotaxis protein
LLPKKYLVELFANPNAFTRYMRAKVIEAQVDLEAQREVVSRWKEEAPLIPQILSYWSKTPERYGLPQICIIDYFLPGVNGIKALEAAAGWSGPTVLLTGLADDQVVIEAFNARHIDRYVPKQAASIRTVLLEAVESLQFDDGERAWRSWAIWGSTLQRAHSNALLDPAISNTLAAFIRERWIDYVILGDPFGVLGMDKDGNVQWMQLETSETLRSAVEVAVDARLPAQAQDSVRNKQALHGVEMVRSVARNYDHDDPGLLQPVSFRAEGSVELLGAIFPIDPRHCPPAQHSYTAWLETHSKRRIHTD